MEEALKVFYERMTATQQGDTASLLRKLAVMEEGHKAKLRDTYLRITDSRDTSDLEKEAQGAKIMEGGFTMEESLKANLPNTPADVITKAMMFEAQALDLYLRYSRKIKDTRSADILISLADDEKNHLSLLGGMMEKTV